MTIMGIKRDPNEPRKPLKRSYIKRKAPKKAPSGHGKAITGGKTAQGKAKEHEAFMAQFRGRPSIISGRTRSEVLRDENWNLLKTEGHHILPRSVYPEYRHCEWNIAVLTREEHGHVEDHQKDFDHWLHDHHPLIWNNIEEHRHHRKDNQ